MEESKSYNVRACLQSMQIDIDNMSRLLCRAIEENEMETGLSLIYTKLIEDITAEIDEAMSYVEDGTRK